MRPAPLVARALESLPSQWISPFDVQWHNSWDADVERAYEAVDGDSWLPADVVRALRTNVPGLTHRLAVVSRGARVVAVVPLVERGERWEPIAQGVVPGIAPFPSREHPARVAAALGRAVRFRGMPGPAPSDARPGAVYRLPCYELPLDQDPEEYWRKAGRIRVVRKARERTQHLVLAPATAAELRWIHETWHTRWRTGSPAAVSGRWRERLAAFELLAPRGLARATVLRDGETPVSGLVTFAVEGTLHFGTACRDRRYDALGVGGRLFDAAILWAYAQGFRAVSMGVGHDYKRWWAPRGPDEWSYSVAPRHVDTWLRFARRASEMLGRDA